MRILCVTPYYSPEGGGLERYAHRMNAQLVRRGHEVRAVASTKLGHGPADQDGVQVERFLPLWRAGNTPILPQLARMLRDRIRAQRADVVLAHTPVPFPAEMAYLAARAEGVPLAVVYHAGSLRGSSALLDLAARVDRLTLERRMLAHAKALVAVSPYVLEHPLRRHRARTTVVPPGVDTAQFRPALGVARRKEVLFVASLSRSYAWKGVDVLWDAFANVRRAVPDATLRLVGSGDRYDEFVRRANGAAGAVRVEPRLGEDELVRAYQECAVVALPSLTDSESFGMVLAEANACGTPVVASAVGGIPSFVRDGENGLLVPPGDADALAQALCAVLQNPERAAAMGEAGRARVENDHDWGRLAERLEGVLTAAQGPKARAVAAPAAR